MCLLSLVFSGLPLESGKGHKDGLGLLLPSPAWGTGAAPVNETTGIPAGQWQGSFPVLTVTIKPSTWCPHAGIGVWEWEDGAGTGGARAAWGQPGNSLDQSLG